MLAGLCKPPFPKIYKPCLENQPPFFYEGNGTKSQPCVDIDGMPDLEPIGETGKDDHENEGYDLVVNLAFGKELQEQQPPRFE